MKPKLFGSSGIRGLANIDITPTLAQRVGAALATLHEGGATIIGRDARITGPMLEAALTSGVNAAGGDVVQVGLVPTPVVAWMIKETGSESGVAITASHNPPPYNGLKVFNGKGVSLTIAEQLQLEAVLENERYEWADWDRVGAAEEIDGIEPYVDMLAESIEIETEHKVGLDCFCGATCTLAPAAFREFPVEAKIINAVPDGRFPAGNPEPTSESLRRLGEYMKSTGCGLGFGFDGDGDRMMPVGADGRMVSPDRALAAYAGYVVERNNGGTVVTHVGASMNVDDMVKAAGGKIVRTPVGDAFITEAMMKHKAVFGGEPVGAWVFPEHHMCPAGVMGALKVLEALDYMDQTLEEFVQAAPAYPLERAKLDCTNQKKSSALKEISTGYGDVFRDVESVSTVDGVRLEMPQGWTLIRPSGTEPLIRITVEGRTQEDVDRIMEKAKQLVKKAMG
ncbi:phosphoglucosamine mutase [Candidatus Bathyarchaeota archaeon]|nr:phosphoglucosamine mutase [Candidatus Bathyarchaeota archaeon]